MKLSEFLKKNGMKQKFLAEKIRYTPHYVNAFLKGRRKPSKHFIEAVKIFTNGQVSEEDWEESKSPEEDSKDDN